MDYRKMMKKMTVLAIIMLLICQHSTWSEKEVSNCYLASKSKWAPLTERVKMALAERNAKGQSNFPPDILREDEALFLQVRQLQLPIYSKQDDTIYVWSADCLMQALRDEYKKGINDEIMMSIITIDRNGRPAYRLAEGGAVLDVNFRKDRQMQWVSAVSDPEFNDFTVCEEAQRIAVSGMTRYVPELAEEMAILDDLNVKNGLAEVLASEEVDMVYVFSAEKGKFIPAYRGGKTEPYEKEDLTYGSVSMPVLMTQEQVEMFQPDICKQLDESRYVGWFYGGVPQGLKQIPNKKYRQFPGLSMFRLAEADVEMIGNAKPGTVGLTNLDGPDLIGHVAAKETEKIMDLFVEKADGEFELRKGDGWAAVMACLEVADQSIKMIYDAVKARNGVFIMVGDHGSVDDMSQPSHSFNDVPIFIIDFENEDIELVKARGTQKNTQADVAVTVLHILGIEKPDEMTGRSLLPSSYTGRKDRIVWQIILDGFGHVNAGEDPSADEMNAFGVAMEKGKVPTIKGLYDRDKHVILKASGRYAGLRGGLIQEIQERSAKEPPRHEVQSKADILYKFDQNEKAFAETLYNRIKIVLYDYNGVEGSSQTYGYEEGVNILRNSPYFNDKYFLVNYLQEHWLTEYEGSDVMEVICLDPSQMGSTEYNTWTLGAGRIVEHTIRVMDKKCIAREIVDNKALQAYLATARKQGYAHFVGILQEAGVHASARHLYYLIEHLKNNGIEKFVFDLASDGRDEDSRRCLMRIAELRSALEFFGITEYVINIRGRENCFDRAKNHDLDEAWINELLWGSRSRRVPLTEDDSPEGMALLTGV